jgi:ubiquilin
MAPINVNFKMSGAGGATFSLDVEPTITVRELKALAKEKSGIEPEHMKVIFKGRILKDAEVLEAQSIVAGCTVHLVKSAPNATTASTTQATTPSTTDAPAPSTAIPGITPPTTSFGGPPAGVDPMMQMMQQMMSGGGMGGGMGAGGMGGMPGLGGMGMDPAMMGQMLQNPMVQQMMQQMTQNPQMLQQMIQSNPMLQGMMQNNPMMQQMLSNPDMLQQVLNPQNLQVMMQMQQAMGGMGAPGTNPQAATMQGIGAPNPMSGSPNPMEGFDPAMMAQMMQALQGDGLGGGMPPTGGMPLDSRPLEEKFASQNEQLKTMGFTDDPSNFQALQMANGDMNQAMDFLIGGN